MTPIWLTVLLTAGTWLVSVVAIFGEPIRARLNRPKLQISLVDNFGKIERKIVEESVGQTDQYLDAELRNYRLRVTNRVRFPVAEEVYVLVTRFEKRGPDGRPQPEFTEETHPVNWRHAEKYPSARRIGPATVADVDLLTVRKDNGTLTLNIKTGTGMLAEQHFWVTIVARGINGESAPLRLKVDWDGQWHTGDVEMGRHLTIHTD